MEFNTQYIELLSKQKLALREALKRRGEIPTDRPSKQAIIQNFMAALIAAKSMKQQPSHNKFFYQTSFIPPAYPPCTKPLAELKKIMIENLKLETSHRGRFLLVRVLTPPDRMTAIMAIVEDENGEAVLLQLYQQEDEHVKAAAKVLNEEMVVVVKEPYFKQMVHGGYGLRVDHVGDVLWLREGDARIPGKWGPRVMELDKTATRWKEEGNAAANKNEYWKAISCYTAALECPASSDEIQIIKRNRAYAYLQTGQFDAVLSDLSYPFTGPASTQPEKALFRAAKALYSLQRFRECFEILKVLRQEHPTNPAAQPELARVIARIIEQEKGQYKFAAMEKEAENLRPPRLDHATYVGPVEVRMSKGCGRGLFLTKDVRAGVLLLCEKAFDYSFATNMEENSKTKSSTVSLLINTETDYFKMGTTGSLSTSIIQKLFKNPSLAAEFTALYHGSYQTVPPVGNIDGVPVVDSFLVERIIQFNAFGSCVTSLSSHLAQIALRDSDIDPKQESPEEISASGIWVIASCINHSCLSNCRRSFIGDMLVIRATEDIAANTELVFPYIPCISTDHDYDATKEKLLKTWKFTCSCILCADAKTTDKKLAKKRKDLSRDFDIAFDSEILKNNRSFGKFDAARIERILGALEKCYINKIFEKIPRKGLWVQYLALTRTHAGFGKPLKVVWGVLKVLEMLAFSVSGFTSAQKPFVVEKWGMVVDDLVECWMLLWTSFAVLGQTEKAEQAKSLAAVSYRIVIGEDETFEKVYGSKGKSYIASGMIWNGF